jgi:hypothetical protein
LILRGGVEKARAENDIARQRNYELATLVAYAFHDPEKMPKFGGSAQDEKQVSDEVAHAQVRGFFMALANKSGG